jgi:signal transduction histidine kinase
LFNVTTGKRVNRKASTLPWVTRSIPPLAAPLEIETRRLLLGLLTQHTPGMVAANIVVATVFAMMMWLEIADFRIWFWLCLPLSINLLRLGWNRYLLRNLQDLPAHRLPRAEQISLALITLNGLAWGGLAWFVFNGDQINEDFVTLSVVVGMSGGSLTPLATLRNAFPLYSVSVMLPFMAKSFWIGGNIYIASGIILTTYLAVLFVNSRTTHRELRHAFHLQLEKDQLLQELESVARSRSLFLAGVSHDLKQPVQALGMFTACLEGQAREQSGALGEELKRLARNSGLALAAINGQVTRLLELSRLEAGEVQPHHRRIRLADIYDYTRAQQADKAAEKGVRLRFAATSLEVVSDLKMLQSICDNLVSNAVRYTQTGHVLVGARRRSKTVEIQVWDTGPGIPAEHIPLLFEAYRRFDDTARGADVGFGLGLALVKKQVDLLDHDLRVRSCPGRGSVFCVVLPRA